MILKGWPKTWPGSTRSVSTEEKCGLDARPQKRAARRYAALPLKLWRSSSLQKVFVVYGTLCHRVPCKGRRQVPPQPKRLPRASHHAHALLFVGHARSRSARWPFTPQSSLYSPLKPAVVAREIARTFSQGFGASCLRAPGLRRPFAPSRPLQPTGCCSPLSAVGSTVEDAGCSLPCRSASTAPHMHHADRCEAQRPRRASTPRTSKGSRRRSSVSSRR